jgi:hypothetical protein
LCAYGSAGHEQATRHVGHCCKHAARAFPPKTRRRQLLAEAAAAKARAEAEGVEEDGDDAPEEEDEGVIAEAEAAPGGVCARSARVQALRLQRAAWRVRVVAAAAGGEEPDEALLANALSYEGGFGSRAGAALVVCGRAACSWTAGPHSRVHSHHKCDEAADLEVPGAPQGAYMHCHAGQG